MVIARTVAPGSTGMLQDKPLRHLARPAARESTGMVQDKLGVPEQAEQELLMGIILLIWKLMDICTTGIQLLTRKDFVQMVGMCLVMVSGIH